MIYDIPIEILIKNKNKTTILSLDETPLVAAAFRWTLELLQSGDNLLILGCANPTIPPGRSPDNFAKIRWEEAVRVRERFRTILGIVGSEDDVKKNINVSFDIEPWKLNQPDHIISTISKIQPNKIILFLDDKQQPSITRWMNGHVSSYIASKVSSNVRPAILSEELLRRLDDRDIFGNF